MIRSVVRGFGAQLPERVMKNSDLESIVETNDDWIVQRTGIRQRHIAGEKARPRPRWVKWPRVSRARARQHDARRYRSDRLRNLDARQHLSRHRGQHSETALACTTARPLMFRLSARASSSPSPLPTATSSRASRARVLVIGAETFSRILDWTDRTTCVLFGDGAGAIVLEAEEGAVRLPTGVF
jgi:3-oxoacyl-[acyl-carrier-protein] synthase-3